MTDQIAISVLKMIETHGRMPELARQKAIEALEKQVPKKPVDFEDKMWGCPCCNNHLMWKWDKYPTKLQDKRNGLPYCLNCGQAIDWGAIE